MADFKVVSQNLMHSSVTITDRVYSVLNDREVSQRIRSLGNSIIIVETGQELLSRFDERLLKLEQIMGGSPLIN